MQIDFGKIVGQVAKDAGVELKTAGKDLTDYANGRAIYLQTLQGQQGFEEALKAEALAIVEHGAGDVVDEADAADAKVIGGVFTLLLAALA